MVQNAEQAASDDQQQVHRVSVFVCLRVACGRTRVLETTVTRTTTKMKTEGKKTQWNEHGTILNFPCAPVGSRQRHQLYM